MGLTVTSLKVDEELWKKLKIKCIQEDMELNQALSKALKLYLGIKEKKP